MNKSSMKCKHFTILLLTILLMKTPLALATDIPIEGYVEGGLNLQNMGAWTSGINFSEVAFSSQNSVVTWTAIQDDKLAFSDDTSTPGFDVMMSVSDFTQVNGGSATIPASGIKMFFHYADGQPGEPTSGFEDANKNLDILPGNCVNPQLSNYNFNADFYDSQKNYSIAGSNNATTIFSSDLDCLNIGYLRLDHIEMAIPGNSPAGDYAGNITFTIVDGL